MNNLPTLPIECFQSIDGPEWQTYMDALKVRLRDLGLWDDRFDSACSSEAPLASDDLGRRRFWVYSRLAYTTSGAKTVDLQAPSLAFIAENLDTLELVDDIAEDKANSLALVGDAVDLIKLAEYESDETVDALWLFLDRHLKTHVENIARTALTSLLDLIERDKEVAEGDIHFYEDPWPGRRELFYSDSPYVGKRWLDFDVSDLETLARSDTDWSEIRNAHFVSIKKAVGPYLFMMILNILSTRPDSIRHATWFTRRNVKEESLDEGQLAIYLSFRRELSQLGSALRKVNWRVEGRPSFARQIANSDCI